MSLEGVATGTSLGLLTFLLALLCARSVTRFLRERSREALPWSVGLGLATGAMFIETVVFAGTVSDALLETYIFLSAALVGVLSIGATHVFDRPQVARGYAAYMVATLGLVGGSTFSVAPPPGMVAGGVIQGSPAPVVLLLSSLVTFPATIVLLTSSAMALRRTRRWQTLLTVAGALILGAGGTLYIASFPAALYYTEFVGILLLFFGLVSLPRSVSAPVAAPNPMLAV